MNLLLMIAGGGGGDWNGFVNHFTDTYTVVTYDRRGSLRSTLDHPVEDIPLEIHSDDAHRLLAVLTTEPAYVFGSSAGALIGLDLVAHEPPAHYLLPDADQSQDTLSKHIVVRVGLQPLSSSRHRLAFQEQVLVLPEKLRTDQVVLH